MLEGPAFILVWLMAPVIVAIGALGGGLALAAFGGGAADETLPPGR
jgi:hypothetical protein